MCKRFNKREGERMISGFLVQEVRIIKEAKTVRNLFKIKLQSSGLDILSMRYS
jgi:hypothetical protein